MLRMTPSAHTPVQQDNSQQRTQSAAADSSAVTAPQLAAFTGMQHHCAAVVEPLMSLHDATPALDHT